MTDAIRKYFLLLVYFHSVSTSLVNDRFYPRFHIAPPHGWMNDPNGMSRYRNEYHLFYQYNPESSLEPGIAHWGHVKSKDFIHWQHLPIAMYPDKWYDKTGVFSGSALIENDTMYLYYTGNVKYPNENPDHANREALGISKDGVNVVKHEGNPIIWAKDHQPNIRDPKVWEHDGAYYMVLGNSFENDTLGRILLYSSKDKIKWEEESIIEESDGSLGYMWECPDLFKLDDYYVLLFSPQGVEPQGYNYRNLYQTGYFIGFFDYETKLFTAITEFREIDHGHDFYATQTMVDEFGDRIMIAWFDMWEQNYPEQEDGFTGCMTLPRKLTLSSDLRILQTPVDAIKSARSNKLATGKAQGGSVVKLSNKAGEILIESAPHRNLEVIVESNGVNGTVVLSYNYLKGLVTLERGGIDGIRRTKWRALEKLVWKIYVDASAVELFCGKGEVTFSSRFFPERDVQVRLGNNSDVDDFTVFEMERTVPKPGDS